MLTIRLARQGGKKRPFYHIVATDSRKPRDSGYKEKLGFFNPSASGQEEILRIDQERLEYWLSKGGKMSDRIQYLYKSHTNGKDLRAQLDAHRKASADRVQAMREESEKALEKKLAEKAAAAEAAKASAEADDAEAESPDEATAQASEEAAAESPDETTEQASDEAAAEVSDEATEQASEEAAAEAPDEATEQATDEAAAESSDEPPSKN